VDYLDIYLRAVREPIPALQESFDAEIQFLLSFVTSTSSVLDIGCGAGRVAQLLAPHIESVIGIDNDERVLEIARKECQGLSNIEILHGDALALPFQDATFDTTYSTMNTIGSFPEDEQVTFLEGMARVTKPSGHVINTTWRTDRGATEDIRKYYEHYYQEEGYDILEIDETKTVTVKGTFERLSEEKLRKIYDHANLQNVEFTVLGPLFLGAVGLR